jgi:hypothetical protein
LVSFRYYLLIHCCSFLLFFLRGWLAV